MKNPRRAVYTRHIGNKSILPWVLASVPVFVLLAALALASGSQSHQTRTPTDAPSNTGGNTMSFPGGKAITPHLNLSSTDPNTPTYTAADAGAFALAHQLATVRVFGPTSIASVQFMTGAQLNQMVKHTTTIAPTRFVCVVMVHGTFQSQVHVPGAKKQQNWPKFSTQIYVFDGKTGNFLMATGMDPLTPFGGPGSPNPAVK